MTETKHWQDLIDSLEESNKIAERYGAPLAFDAGYPTASYAWSPALGVSLGLSLLVLPCAPRDGKPESICLCVGLEGDPAGGFACALAMPVAHSIPNAAEITVMRFCVDMSKAPELQECPPAQELAAALVYVDDKDELQLTDLGAHVADFLRPSLKMKAH